MTNFEKIKNMSVEEMASELEERSNYVCCHYSTCNECPFDFLGRYDCNIMGFRDWLNSEVEE